EYIKEGDIFEVNLAQRFSAPFTNPEQSYALYQRLSQINPSPFSAFLNFGECKILSASPERFIRLENRCVETRPIKGTRARHVDPIQDKQHISELLNSEKDFAENIMIVDLMRNDLAKVCEDDSIIVTQLCAHEVYPTVHHLVSVIRGQLKVSKTAFDLLKAVFPGGSITGAPKIRAMQIIAELEPHCRGPYCGNLILLGFDGYMDSSILIRTFVLNKDKLTFHAGGAVVLDSDPKMEYEETLIKAYALQKALNKDPI
ncbi:MAG TPA: anthranilate synthase component I family protein, partial [Legionellaceae bacterium]|nr:anthranilate synthase component I family protein [Legionellaceae bacterium]